MIDYVALAAQRNASRGLDEFKVSRSKDKIIAARKEKKRRYNNRWRKKKWAECPEYFAEVNRKRRQKNAENIELARAKANEYHSRPEVKARYSANSKKYYWSHEEFRQKSIAKAKKWAQENAERKKASNLEYLNRNKELLRVKGIVRYQVRYHPEVLQGHTMRELYEIEFKKNGIEFPTWSKRFCDWLDKVDGVCNNENGNTSKDN